MRQRAPVRSLTVVAIALEALAKVTLLGTLFALFVMTADPLAVATFAACFSAISTAARTLVKGELLRRRLVDVFGAAESTLAGKSLAELASSRDKLTSGSLFQAALDVSTTQSGAFPDAVAAVIVLLVILVTVAVRLGPHFVLLGFVGALGMFIVLSPLRKRARIVGESAFKGHTRTMRMLDALVFGSFEVRGAGADAALSRKVRALVAEVARLERQVHWLSITAALIPAALAIAVLVVPREWMLLLLRDKLGEASVLVAAGVSSTVSLVTSLEALARSSACRSTLSAFLGRPVGFFDSLGGGSPRTTPQVVPQPKALRVEGFTHRYEGSSSPTPGSISFELKGHGGIALVGPNGAGKTTTLMALLGLIETDAVRVDGRVPTADEWASLRAHTCVLPQRAYVVSDETIGWHLSLFGSTTLDEDRVAAALDQFGVGTFLADRAKRRGCAVTDLVMGELSGGEQRRVLLARIALSTARIVLLDEPEVGLDEASRRQLRAFLEEVAQTRMLVLVCHHSSVIPEHWPTVEVAKVGSCAGPGNQVRERTEPAIVL